MKELQMNENMYVTLHAAADRVALEAARKITNEVEAVVYIETYWKVLEFLISEYEKNDVEP
jgi:hypothetical protein